MTFMDMTTIEYSISHNIFLVNRLFFVKTCLINLTNFVSKTDLLEMVMFKSVYIKGMTFLMDLFKRNLVEQIFLFLLLIIYSKNRNGRKRMFQIFILKKM